MKLQTCSRHPEAGEFALNCPGCKQARYDRELSNRVRAALDMGPAAPRAENGEHPTRVLVWSIRELNDVFGEFGGTVSAEDVHRVQHGVGAYDTVEVTVTLDLPHVGAVRVFTEWDAAEEAHALALPVMAALPETARA